MNPIAITVTGRLGDDPRTFTTRDGTAGVELRLAVEIPGRDQNITRWIKVVAFGLLASRTAASVGKGNRVTVIADDLTTDTWLSSDNQPRARVSLRAREIAASMAYDQLRTGYADRKAARALRVRRGHRPAHRARPTPRSSPGSPPDRPGGAGRPRCPPHRPPVPFLPSPCGGSSPCPSGPIPPLRVGSPADLLAIVPHLLGFIPATALVVLGARGPRRRSRSRYGSTCPTRPTPGRRRHRRARRRGLVPPRSSPPSSSSGPPRPTSHPGADTIRDPPPARTCRSMTCSASSDSRYWSYLCPTRSCCPPRVSPSPPTRLPRRWPSPALPAVRFALIGIRRPPPSRRVAGPTADAMRGVPARASGIAHRLIARRAATADPAGRIIGRGSAVQPAVTAFAAARR